MQRPQIPVARHIPMPGSHLPSMPSAPSHMLSSVQCPSSAQFTAQPSTSASVSNPTTVPATRTLGSKTRIVVPDENISLVSLFSLFGVFWNTLFFRKRLWQIDWSCCPRRVIKWSYQASVVFVKR
jgi:hypothetical protein